MQAGSHTHPAARVASTHVLHSTSERSRPRGRDIELSYFTHHLAMRATCCEKLSGSGSGSSARVGSWLAACGPGSCGRLRRHHQTQCFVSLPLQSIRAAISPAELAVIRDGTSQTWRLELISSCACPGKCTGGAAAPPPPEVPPNSFFCVTLCKTLRETCKDGSDEL